MKNNCRILFIGAKNALVRYVGKIPLAMRCTLLMIFCAVSISFARDVRAQRNTVSLNLDNATVGEVLSELEQSTEYTFFYNNNQVDVSRRISVSAQNQSVFDILERVFDGTDVTYKVLDDSIILSKGASRQENAAQQRRNVVKFKVLDAKGEPVIGAGVMIAGTTKGAITDVDGTCELEAESGSKIEVSCLGFLDKSLTLSGTDPVTITLEEDSKTLDEVVVIGYGTVKKSDMTGSLSSVSEDSYKNQNVTRIDEALQGRAAGVQISNTVGAPGGEVRIRIRGANSVLGDNSPLFVIDGFVGGDFNLLNPSDIKSIEVLKDASSTAIYGSRGANGVVLVTTKSGSTDGKVTVSYQGSVSFSDQIKKYKMLSAGDFAKTVNEHDAALGVTNLQFSQDDIDGFYKNGGFDYNDAIYHTGFAHQHQIGVSGGTPKTQYRISGSFLDQDGIVRKSGFKRYTVRANVNTNINKKLSFRFNANGSLSQGRGNQARSGAGNPVVQALAWAPTTNPYDGNGGYLINDPVGSLKPNPLAIIYDTEHDFERTMINVMGGARYEIIPGLSADFQAAADLGYFNNKSWSGVYESNNKPDASKNNSQSVTIQTTSQLSYDKTFGAHHINAVAVIETQKYKRENLNGSANNLKFSDLKYDNLAQAESGSVSSGFNGWQLVSYLGRINYTLLNRYLFSFSVRHDGSSKFAKGNRFSTFPAGAVAWNAGNEDFIKKLGVFDKLKVRFSWGLTGSQAIEPYATLSAYNTNPYYSFETNIKTNGIQMANPGNARLKWETTEQQDLGIEMAFFNSRLSLEFDYFRKHTRDLLLNKSVPYYIGGGTISSNVGEIKNHGIEFSIVAKVISTKDWGWESTFNFSSVENKVTNLGGLTRVLEKNDPVGTIGQPSFVYEKGHSLGSFWGLTYLGPWQKEDAEEAAKYGCVPGDARYADLNGDHLIDGKDYHIIGCGMPKYTLGWNNTVSFKNFTLNAFFQGSFGADKMNYTRAMHLLGGRDARQATLAEIKERYIPGVNEDAWLPAFGKSSKWDPQSTLFMENANYLRLKNLSLSYDFKVKKVADFRASVSATNLFTITKYKGIDPEASNYGGGNTDTQQGIDYGAYPNSKTYTIGLSITF